MMRAKGDRHYSRRISDALLRASVDDEGLVFLVKHRLGGGKI